MHNNGHTNGNTRRKESVDYEYTCPCCGGNAVATLKPDREDWLLYCRSVSCGGRPDHLFQLVDAVGAPSPEALKADPKQWFKKAGRRYKQRSSDDRPPDPIPSRRSLSMFMATIGSDPSPERFLTEERALKPETWGGEEVGYARAGEVQGVFSNHAAFTFPVYERGKLVNVIRRFWPQVPMNRHGKAVKYVGLTGRGSQLYPEPPDDDRVCIVEGLLDCLIMRQHGFCAVTSTTGTTWKDEWTEYIGGCQVAIIYDPEGMPRARQLAQRLGRRAKKAWAVDLSVAGLGPKEDLTDFFLYGGTARDLRKIINAARREASR